MKNNPVVKILKVIVMALLTTLWMFLRMIGRFLMGFLSPSNISNSHDDSYVIKGSVDDRATTVKSDIWGRKI